LSSGNVPAGYGVKLFVIDNKTICAIAGWYSSSGPTIDQIHYPAYEAVPKVINLVTTGYPQFGSLSLEKKLDLISSTMEFTLEVIDRMAAASGFPSDPGPSEITLAVEEEGSIKIAQTRLERSTNGGEVLYEHTPSIIKTVGDGLTYCLAGRTAIGNRILGDRNNIDRNDPILANLREQLVANEGKDLSLSDLQQIAKKVAHLTSDAEKNLVGGPLQIATIEHGLAHMVEQPEHFELGGDPLPSVLKRITGGATDNSVYGTLSHRGFIDNYTFRNVQHQPLDDLYIFNTTFDHCGLFYNGSPAFIFDRSNTVRDSTLTLGPNVDPASPVIQKIRRDFPGLSILSNFHPGP
jgi:hypothetical protein